MRAASQAPARRIALLALAVAASAVAACAAPRPSGPDVHGLWRIDQAQSEPLLDRRHARLDFRRDGTLVGHTSCNTLTAPYTLAGTKLSIGKLGTTRMACGELQMEQEDRVLTALEAAVSARVRDDGLLELRDADGRGRLRGTRFEMSEAGATGR